MPPNVAALTLPRRAAIAVAASAFVSAAPTTVDPGLNDRAMAGGRFFGTAVNDRLLEEDRAYMNRVRADCGMVTGETAFKWGELRPKAGEWNWRPANAVMAFAARRGIQTRGHTLLWHEHNPQWLLDELSPGSAEQLLTRHIHTVTKPLPQTASCNGTSSTKCWSPEDGKPFGFRNSPWYRAMGQRFLETAFHACAEADPVALRFINEYGLEYTWPEHEAKRQDHAGAAGPDAGSRISRSRASASKPTSKLACGSSTSPGSPGSSPTWPRWATRSSSPNSMSGTTASTGTPRHGMQRSPATPAPSWTSR